MAKCSVDYSRRQWSVLFVLAIASFTSAACQSILAPFYPRVAEFKGVTPSQYGFVFGIHRLIMCLFSPFYGKYMNKIGPKFMFNVGLFTTGATSVLFGYLDDTATTADFLSLSFAVRIVGAILGAGFTTARNSITASEFPNSVGTIFATMETCFGMGQFAGPTVGGALYEIGGYRLPFIVLGVVLVFVTGMSMAILPMDPVIEEDDEGNSKKNTQPSMLAALKVPAIAFFAVSIIFESFNSGFLQATLEPHLRQLQLSPLKMGFMFVLNGGAYALTAPLWGILSDKFKVPARVLVFIGAILVSISFLLVGPAPFIPLETTIPLCVVALIFLGVGCSAELVATFSGSLAAAHEAGFPEDLSTCGLISGIWASSFALGSFVGPSVGGAALEFFGFKWASQIVVAMHTLLAVVTAFLMLSGNRKEAKDCLIESVPLVGSKEKKRGHNSTYGSLESSLSDYGSISSLSIK